MKNNPKIYASKNIQRHIKRLINKHFVKSGLKIERVAGGMIVVDEKLQHFGVFDSNGIFVKQSLLSRGKGQLIPTESAFENPLYLDYDAVYVGNIAEAFGHYLLEHWNRVYAFLDEKYKDMKFVIVNNERFDPVPKFVGELARLLGIPAENFIILNKSAKFRNVYVPEDSFKFVSYSSKEFGQIYAKIADNVKREYDFEKIYVSRAALELRKTYGEEKVQSIFEKNGYHIVYPEQLSLEEQIALMKGCKSLAGCAGTALHLALFMPAGGNVIHLKRNKLKADNCGAQYLITECKGQHLVVVEASIEKHKTTHFDDHPQIVGVNEHLKRFFDDNGFKYTSKDLEFDNHSWEEYLLHSEKFEHQRREKFGGKSKFEIRFLRTIVQFMACFIYNRHKRVTFRTKMRKTWGILD